MLSRAQAEPKTPIAQILTDTFRDKDVTGRMRKIVGPAVVQSVAAGYGILPSVGYQPAPKVVDAALSLRWDPNSMGPLSDQIHGTALGYRRELEDSLRQSFAQAKTVQQAARAIYDGYQPGFASRGPFAAITPNRGAPTPYLPVVIQDGVNAASLLSPGDKIRLNKYAEAVVGHAEQMKVGPLRTSYMELAKALDKAGQGGLERAIRVATEEKARYHADRIARTESVRAWGAAFQVRINSDQSVVGIRSRTSGAHKIFDICDFHARADLFGMGPGCYPKDRAPSYPYHPHCTCNWTPIYRKRPSEAPPRDGGPDVDAGARALRGMTDQERRRLLSVHGAQAFQADPRTWINSLRNWSTAGGPNPASASAKAVVDLVKLQTMTLAERAVEEEALIWKNAKFETGVIVREGEDAIRIPGQATSVSIPQHLHAAMKDSLFTHNHPRGWAEPESSPGRKGNSLSLPDLRLGSVLRCRSMRAVTPVYAYHLDYNGSYPTYAEITAIHWDAEVQVMSMNPPPERGDWFHEINALVAKRFGWTYSREEHGFK